MASKIRLNFHTESEATINKQINLELHASYVYMAMVSLKNLKSILSFSKEAGIQLVLILMYILFKLLSSFISCRVRSKDLHPVLLPQILTSLGSIFILCKWSRK